MLQHNILDHASQLLPLRLHLRVSPLYAYPPPQTNLEEKPLGRQNFETFGNAWLTLFQARVMVRWFLGSRDRHLVELPAPDTRRRDFGSS